MQNALKSLIQSSTVKYAIAAVLIGMGIYLFWQTILDYLLEIFGFGLVGAAAVAAKKRQAAKAVTVAEEYEIQADIHVAEAAREIEEAKESLREAEVGKGHKTDKSLQELLDRARTGNY